jgi:hypothetical protein
VQTIYSYYTDKPFDVGVSSQPNKFLYLMERGGVVLDTTYGKPVALSDAQFQQTVAGHHRLWVIGPEPGILPPSPTILGEFVERAETSGAALYLHG